MSDRDTLAELLTQNLDSHYGIDEDNEEAIEAGIAAGCAAALAKGWRPPAREVTTVGELEALPGQPVVLDSWGEAWQRIHGNWRHISGRICVSDELVLNFGPKFTVLHVPTEEATR